jgi:hypothetical protein
MVQAGCRWVAGLEQAGSTGARAAAPYLGAPEGARCLRGGVGGAGARSGLTMRGSSALGGLTRYMRTIQCSLVNTSSKYLSWMSCLPMAVLRTRSSPRRPNAFSDASAYLRTQRVA